MTTVPMKYFALLRRCDIERTNLGRICAVSFVLCMEAQRPPATCSRRICISNKAPAEGSSRDTSNFDATPYLRTQSDDDQTDHHKKKLFVGMAPKAAYEDDFSAIFALFGTLINIYVIRDRDGFSKGCAFVKYDSVQSAQNAIDALHDKYIMPGGFRTLVVTIADDRRSPPSTTNTWHSADDISSGGRLSGFYSTISRSAELAAGTALIMSCGSGPSDGYKDCWRGHVTPSTATQQPIAAPPAAYAVADAASSPTTSMSTMVPGMSYFFCGGSLPRGTYVYYPGSMPPSAYHQRASLAAATGIAGVTTSPYSYPTGPAPAIAVDAGMTEWFDGRWRMDRSLASTSIGLAQQSPMQHGTLHRGHSKERYYGTERFSTRDMGIVSPEEEGRRWAKQPVGPPGANLFVYYLPELLSDADLATAFSPFGEVLSAKVYFDRDTGESKGFGEQEI